MQAFIPRRLRDTASIEGGDFGHEALLEIPRNVVLLGEAGAGKTRLTKWLDDAETHTRCTARQLINGVPNQLLRNAKVLVIDALDEVASNTEGGAVNSVLRALREANYPRFILSCRLSEWRAATMREAICEQYGEAPLEVEIAPLADDDARAFLSAHLKDVNRATEVVWHFQKQGLSDWLGNPQTLEMLGDIARDDSLPETASALFRRYVELTWFEHSEQRPDAPLRTLGKLAVLDALGAGFAALILTGSAALSDSPQHLIVRNDLPRADVAQLLGAEHLDVALKSRLCIGPAGHRTFQHKRIGEYLGARWLAKGADTPSKRARLVTMLQSNGIVPANLRGLHAWLAIDPHLAHSVIQADPAGVIEYGDANDLTEGQGQVLLKALAALIDRNPMFRAGWNPQARCLVKGALLHESWRILTERSEEVQRFQYPFALRIVIARQLSEPQVVEKYRDGLHMLLLDQDQPFAIRTEAGKALTAHGGLIDWSALLETLRHQATATACRLAVDLLDAVRFEGITDRQIVEIILAYEGITLCARPKETDERRTAGTLQLIDRTLSDERLDGVLGEFAAFLEPFAKSRWELDGAYELRTLIGKLICRRLALTDQRPLPNPIALWQWLRPFNESPEEVTAWLKAHNTEKRAIQRFVLIDLEGDKNLNYRLRQLIEPLPGAALDSSDLAMLLDGLDLSDNRWRALLEMIPHHGVKGMDARAAAKRFVAHNPNMLRWIDDLAISKPPEWESQDSERRQTREEQEPVRHAEHRAAFLAQRDGLLTGNTAHSSALACLAQAYLGVSSELPKNVPPHKRIALWMGEDIQIIALAGFEAFLTNNPPEFTAEQIADSWPGGLYRPDACILIAALMERLRKKSGFDDLPVERLIAAMLQIKHGLARPEVVGALDVQIAAELKSRNAYEAYARLLIEPHLRKQRENITGLHGLMRDTTDAHLSAELAIGWLREFPQMAANVEKELIDCLIRAHERETLHAVATERIADEISDDRRRNWQAVALWTDFASVNSSLAAEAAGNPKLLWAIRDRLGLHRDNNGSVVGLTPQLMSWVVRSFRAAWPSRDHPAGVISGDQHPFYASMYLKRLIAQLGDDSSDEAKAFVTELRDAPRDSYTDYLRLVATEQETKRAELAYTPPSLADIATALHGAPPATHAALCTEVLAALERVQARVRSDHTDCWRGFYRDNKSTPKHEEDCSDHLVNLLALEAPDIRFDPETHVGNDREVDIACSIGNLRIPIEAKGQWNDDLWTAANWQLGGQQAVDHRAGGHGIYLVYWFGPQMDAKPLRKPPDDIESPDTPQSLQHLLRNRLITDNRQDLRVFVLDLAR